MPRSFAVGAVFLFYGSLSSLQAATGPRSDAPPVVQRMLPRPRSLTFGQALKMIWEMAGNGIKPYEAGFALDRTADGYVIVLAPMTFEPDMKLEIPFNAVGTTVLIAHTHPDEGTDRPTRGNAKRRTGDVYSPVPNYVVSRTGLWVTDPKTATFSRVAHKNWDSFTPPELEETVVFIQIAQRPGKHTK